MQVSTRFSVSIHILLSIVVFKDKFKVTSDFIASSVKTNPVVIRKLMSLLRNGGLVNITRGSNGCIELARPADRITLLDIYEAVEPEKQIIPIHQDTEKACPVGGNIEMLLTPFFISAEGGLKKELQKTTLADLLLNLGPMMGKS